MIRDITIGQYYPTDSVIHRLDPRVKFLGTVIYIITLFLFDSFWGFILPAVFLLTEITLSKIPIKYVVKGLKPMLFLLLFTMLFNLFLTPGKEIIFSWWIFDISDTGLKTSVFMVLRLSILVIGSSQMTFTTTPNQLTDGMEHIFGFLKVFKVPVHEVAMMMSIALRFIPILLEETDKIMKAQQARGADFETGNIFRRVKAMVPILVPLFVSAFRRAGDLAMAMEARCYHGGKGRTKMKPLRYQKRDAVAFLVIAVFFGLMITERIFIG